MTYLHCFYSSFHGYTIRSYLLRENGSHMRAIYTANVNLQVLVCGSWMFICLQLYTARNDAIIYRQTVDVHLFAIIIRHNLEVDLFIYSQVDFNFLQVSRTAMNFLFCERKDENHIPTPEILHCNTISLKFCNIFTILVMWGQFQQQFFQPSFIKTPCCTTRIMYLSRWTSWHICVKIFILIQEIPLPIHILREYFAFQPNKVYISQDSPFTY